jgi:serine/threonine-protein kinase
MGLWSKLFGSKGEKEEQAPAAPSPAAPPRPSAPRAAPPKERAPTDVDRLLRVGVPGGLDVGEALALFQIVRSTPEEGVAIQELLRRHGTTPIPEPLLVAVAAALADRGEARTARASLEGATSTEALMLRADLEADAGDLATALSLVERVLLRSLDHPGARERHERWRSALGLVLQKAPNAATQTMVAAEPDTPYKLLREIARGGAGAVYEAEDRDLGRRVALKVYHEPTRDRAQLLHEVRVAVALAGPGVLRIFDLDPEHGWLCAEYAPLGALREHVRARDAAVLRPVERWAIPLASALARAHDAGWVHLDVKPANVLLIAEDRPVLADFGIARRFGEQSPAGSMGYVSPERMAGRPAEPRDDVFGFGRILEDVLDALADASEEARLRPLARACTGPDAERPGHAREILMRLRALG